MGADLLDAHMCTTQECASRRCFEQLSALPVPPLRCLSRSEQRRLSRDREAQTRRGTQRARLPLERRVLAGVLGPCRGAEGARPPRLPQVCLRSPGLALLACRAVCHAALIALGV